MADMIAVRLRLAVVGQWQGSRMDLPSKSCGRGRNGTPLDLARGGGHYRIAQILQEAMADQPPKYEDAVKLGRVLVETCATGFYGRFYITHMAFILRTWLLYYAHV